MESLASCGRRIRFEWAAAKPPVWEKKEPVAPRADVPGAELRRSRILPPTERLSWLSRDRVGRRRRIAAGGWKTYVGFIDHAAAHRTARSLQEDLTVDGLHLALEVTSCPLPPHSRDI